jgi:FAD/FMN-containing dehydrogenase
MDTSSALPGIEVVTPADAAWDEARRAWNLTVDQRPAAVSTPADAEEVAAAVRAARAAGLRVPSRAPGTGPARAATWRARS